MDVYISGDFWRNKNGHFFKNVWTNTKNTAPPDPTGPAPWGIWVVIWICVQAILKTCPFFKNLRKCAHPCFSKLNICRLFIFSGFPKGHRMPTMGVMAKNASDILSEPQDESPWWVIMIHHDESSWFIMLNHHDASSWCIIMMSHDDSSWWLMMIQHGWLIMMSHHDSSSLCIIMMHSDVSSWRVIMIHHDESPVCIMMMHNDDSSWWTIMIHHDESSWLIMMNRHDSSHLSMFKSRDFKSKLRDFKSCDFKSAVIWDMQFEKRWLKHTFHIYCCNTQCFVLTWWPCHVVRTCLTTSH